LSVLVQFYSLDSRLDRRCPFKNVRVPQIVTHQRPNVGYLGEGIASRAEFLTTRDVGGSSTDAKLFGVCKNPFKALHQNLPFSRRNKVEQNA